MTRFCVMIALAFSLLGSAVFAETNNTRFGPDGYVSGATLTLAAFRAPMAPAVVGPMSVNPDVTNVVNLACQAGCARSFASRSRTCRALPTPYLKAMCWAAAGTANGVCLARCH